MLADGVDPDLLDIGPLGYADAALDSWQTFARLKDEGVIPERTRFQVCMPSCGALLTSFVHPDSAPSGLIEGDAVVLESARGRVNAVLRLDSRQRRDVAIVPKGGSFDRGTSANSLIQARPTDRGLGAAFLDCRVRLLTP